MKKIQVLPMIILMLLLAFTSYGQTTHRQAKRALKDKAIKDARKEAKKWRKQGYTNLPGDPILDKQFETSMIQQFMMDEKGEPMYIVTMGSAVAGSEGVAAANAIDNARTALALQIQSEVSILVSNNKANTQYENQEVETIDEFISNSKTLIQQRLGAIQPAIRMFRYNGKNIEYRYSIIYSLETAKTIAKNLIKEELKEKLDTNEEQLNKLLNL